MSASRARVAHGDTRAGLQSLRRTIAALEARQRVRDGAELRAAALAERLRRRAQQARFAAGGDAFGTAGGSDAVRRLADLLERDADEAASLFPQDGA